MAGGGGTRLWPLSRAERPKPFLPLLDEGRCLLEATVDRLAPLIDNDSVYVVTDARYVDIVAELASGVPAANIIGEPLGRNTAAAVAMAAHLIDRPADEVMVVLPADQAIRDEAGFRAALATAGSRAAAGDMVTLGVQPSGPETGYGYVISTGSSQQHDYGESLRVERFEEKPSPQRAAEMIAAGTAFWNAGTFVWLRSTVIAGLERYAPDISAPIASWVEAHGSAGAARSPGWPGDDMTTLYNELRATSIDYALLEPASRDGRVAVVPMSVGWSDLGSWSALRDHRRGAVGDTVVSVDAGSRVIELDGTNGLVHASGGRTVAVVGLDDIIVVDTPDALLIMSADAAQQVKQIVDKLKAEGRDDLL